MHAVSLVVAYISASTEARCCADIGGIYQRHAAWHHWWREHSVTSLCLQGWRHRDVLAVTFWPWDCRRRSLSVIDTRGTD